MLGKGEARLLEVGIIDHDEYVFEEAVDGVAQFGHDLDQGGEFVVGCVHCFARGEIGFVQCTGGFFVVAAGIEVVVFREVAHNAFAPRMGVQDIEPLIGMDLCGKCPGDSLDLIGVIQIRGNRSGNCVVAQALVAQDDFEAADDVVKGFVKGFSFDHNGQVIGGCIEALAQ